MMKYLLFNHTHTHTHIYNLLPSLISMNNCHESSKIFTNSPTPIKHSTISSLKKVFKNKTTKFDISFVNSFFLYLIIFTFVTKIYSHKSSWKMLHGVQRLMNLMKAMEEKNVRCEKLEGCEEGGWGVLLV